MKNVRPMPIQLNFVFQDMNTWEVYGILLMSAFSRLPGFFYMHLRFAAKSFIKSLRRLWRRLPLLPHAEHARKKREQQNRSSPLARLPGELRNRIYELAMPHSTVLDPSFGSIDVLEHNSDGTWMIRQGKDTWRLYNIWSPASDPAAVWSIFVNMTQVSRFFRSEALAYFYSENRFRFPLQRSRAPYERWWYKRKPKYLERWLASRPRQVLPLLELHFAARKLCPHEWRQTSEIENGYSVLLRLSDTKRLTVLLNMCGPDRRYCTPCLEQIHTRTKSFENGEQWSQARDRWHDKLDSGRLSWRDYLRLINVLTNNFHLKRT